MKKQIRLTENDLHGIITEATRKMLTELDWKTYANAAKKAHERSRNSDKYYDAQYRFRNAATRELANRYGCRAKRTLPNGLEHDRTVDAYFEDYDDYSPNYGRFTPTYRGVMGDGDKYNVSHWFDHAPDGFVHYDNFDTADLPAYRHKNNAFGDDYEMRGRYDAMEDEINAYYNGDYEYVKGKGWQYKPQDAVFDH